MTKLLPRLAAPVAPTPPAADRRAHRVRVHDRDIEDPYFWLKDAGYPKVEDPDILDYLSRENAYYESVMGPERALTDRLFSEIKGRIKSDDESVPWREGPFEYRWAFTAGAQYRSWYRRPVVTGGSWTLILDEPALAAGHDFFRVGGVWPSPCGRFLAYTVDTSGGERFTVHIMDLESGEVTDSSVGNVSSEIVWSLDGTSFITVALTEEWRPYRVEAHALDTSGRAMPALLLYREEDESFFVHIDASSSRDWLMVRAADHETSEVHLIPLDRLDVNPVCVAARQTDHDYTLDHGLPAEDGAGIDFVVRSNRICENFALYRLPSPALGKGVEHWRCLRTGDNRRYIRGHQLFKSWLVVEERVDGLDQLIVWPHAGTPEPIPFDEAAYEVSLDNNPEYDQPFVRIAYSSLITPPSVYDFSPLDGRLALRKEQEIPSGYDKTRYRSERLMVTARDGTPVPVSLVYRDDWRKGAAAPLHLYGYGAYGMGMSPAFSASRLSLLDRGFAYAIAHVRGGDELGYGWYKAGKRDRRQNTFNDFVDVARYLEGNGYAAPGGISISGGSAGGELMGAAVNQAPDLFRAAVLHVPFVDVLNTMLDADLPLTPIEWPEWGNPAASVGEYETIRAYCPYTNITAQDYPPMMVTGGLNDPRVTYWEPAKWTARLRHVKTDDHLLIMKINMGAGHAGKSGRYERLFETAEEYTFLLMAFGAAGETT